MKNFTKFLTAFLLLTLGVGQVWAGDNTVYFCPDLTWSGWKSSDGIKVQVNQQGDGYTWVDNTMSTTGKTYHGYEVFSGNAPDQYGGLGAIQFHNTDWSKKTQPFGEKEWTSTSAFAGKLYDGTNWQTMTFDTKTSVTIYYACTNTENYTIKANVQISNTYDAWRTYTLTNTGKTYNGKNIYSCTLSDYQGGVKKMQLQRYDGSTWKSQIEPISSWTAKANYEGKLYDGSNWVTYAYDVTVTPSATNGSVSPSSATTFLSSGSQEFTATPVTGYHWESWTPGTNVSATNANPTMVTATADGTLTANFAPNTYAVTFSGDNFTPSFTSGTKKDYGSNVEFTLAADDDYAIDEVTSEQVTINKNGSTYSFTMPNNAVTVNVATHSTAVTTYLIRFYDENGTLLKSGQVAENTTPTAPADPTKEQDAEWNYTFDHWNPAIATVTKAQDYTAVYSKTRVPYTLTWDLAGGTAGTGTITTAGSVANATVLQYTVNPTKTGYTFNGWSPTMTSGTTTMPAANTTYTATWTENLSAVTVTTNGVGSHTVSANTSAGVDTHPTLSAEAAKSGYTFNGWTLTGGISLADGSKTSDLHIHVQGDGKKTAGTATANYAEDLSTIWKLRGTFNNNGNSDTGWGESGQIAFQKEAGHSAESVAYANVTLTAGQVLQFKLYNGTSWYGSNVFNVSSTMAESKDLWSDNSSNATLTASVAGTYTFKLNFGGTYPSIQVTYPANYSGIDVHRSNSNAAEPAAISANAVIQGQSVTVTAQAAKTGYTWEGWTSSNGSFADASALSTTFTPTADNAIAQANYNLIPYTITYNVNGGDEVSEKLSYNVETATLALPTPIKSGYSFRGWYDNAELTGDKVTQIAVGTTGNKTFYAKWKQEGWYLHYQTADNAWNERLFSGSPLTVVQEFTDATHNYPMEILKVANGQDDKYYKNANYMTSSNCTSWTYTTSASINGFTSSVAGTYTFSMTVNGEGNPVLTVTYPHFDCTMAISAGAMVGQPATVTFTGIDAGGLDVESYKFYKKLGSAAYEEIEPIAITGGYSYTFTPMAAGNYTFKIEGLSSTSVVLGSVEKAFEVVAAEFTIAATAQAGHFYPGQTITLTPTTNLTGDLTLCFSYISGPAGYENTGFSQVAATNNFTTSASMAGDYVIRATIGSGSCGGEYTTLATYDLNLSIKALPYTLWYRYYDAAGDAHDAHQAFTSGKLELSLLEGKEYEFKIVKNYGESSPVWYSNCSSSTDVNVMVQGDPGPWPMNNHNGSEANTRMATTIAGTYTFTLTLDGADSRKITITYPKLGTKEAYSNAVPSNNTDVMLQAYYWAHEGNTGNPFREYGSVQWADLTTEASEIGDNFQLVWLAPSQATADFTGFIPTNYSEQGSNNATNGARVDWGTYAELTGLISALHAKDVKVIADVVINHSNPKHPDEYTGADPNWCTWSTNNFGDYGTFNPQLSWLAKGDEIFYGKKTTAGDCVSTYDNTNNKEDEFGFDYNGTTYWWSEGEFNCSYARDWAHKNRNVREFFRAYLTWMRYNVGYDGFRYDFAKGFHGSHVQDYNKAAGAQFAVSELFEGSKEKLQGFITTTNKQSYVFDFPAKYQIMNEGIRWGNYSKLLKVNNSILLNDPDWNKYAVTFVDNHDSFHEGSNLCGSANELPNTGNQVLQANAYILSMPGVPCVFYPHWHEYKDAIRAMIQARKAAGINSQSTIVAENTYADGGKTGYFAKIQGRDENSFVVLKLGGGAQTSPGGDYICAYSADNVGMYYKTSDTNVKPLVKADKESQDFFNSISVNLSALGANSATYTIRYTIDGSEPTATNGTVGTTVTINETKTLKAVAYKSDNTSIISEVLTLKYTKVADKLTLNVTGTMKVGNPLTLTVSKLSPEGTAYTYDYQVLEPGAKDYKTIGVTKDKTVTYTLAGGGWYTFRVQTTDAGANTFSDSKRVQVEAIVYYLRHRFLEGQTPEENNWETVAMQDNGDGTYMYYSDGSTTIGSGAGSAGSGSAGSGSGSAGGGSTVASKITVGNGANVGSDIEHLAYFAEIGFTGEGKKITNACGSLDLNTRPDVIWVYNAVTDELKVTNPADKNFRLAITVGEETYYSNIILTAGAAQNISFYCTPTSVIELERIGGGNNSWNSLATITVPAAVDAAGVYSGTINITDQVVDAETKVVTTVASATLTLSKYTGDYKVTSVGTANPENTMIAFDGNHTYYDHYYVEWISSGNTYAMVGNNINNNLANAVGYYKLSSGANVRYAYNPSTNVFTRTHLAGSTSGEKFVSAFGMHLQDTTSAHNALTNPATGATFMDVSDWVYTIGVRSDGNNVQTELKLASQYNGAYTYLLTADGLDADDAKKVLAATGNGLGDNPQFSVIYDYKTNHILSGWSPEGQNISNNPSVPNLIISRTNDEPTSEFTISSGNVMVTDQMITEFVITKKMFTDWTGNTVTEGGVDYKTLFFWFSVPYACRLSDVYGFGTCNKEWNIQRFRGDLRAKGTANGTPWRDLNITSTLEANRGYVLAIKLKESDFKNVTINEKTISEIRLFFPSASAVTLQSTETASLTDWASGQYAATAPIQRDWHVMGVPVMHSGRKMVETGKSTAPFMNAYRWTWAEGGRWFEPFSIVEAGSDYFNFLPGHAYMVQGHGSLTWTYGNAGSGSPLFAPRKAAERANIDLRINLVRDDELQDKAYVYYREDGSRDYEIGRDLEKIENAGRSMIYSELTDKLAAICLADTDRVQIPLTVVADQAGTYSIELPYEIEAMDPVLYDAQEGTTTLLNLMSYSVDLTQGTHTGRFFLGLQAKAPNTPTNINDINANTDEQVLKYLDENGRLMILKQGHLYDATGRLVR